MFAGVPLHPKKLRGSLEADGLTGSSAEDPEEGAICRWAR